MPYICTTTNVGISAEKEKALKQKLGKAIELLPGKSERWLMLSFVPETKMYFHGDSDNMAFVDVSIFGKSSPQNYQSLTSEITKILNEELGIEKDCIYVKYEESSYWGWNGSNF